MKTLTEHPLRQQGWLLQRQPQHGRRFLVGACLQAKHFVLLALLLALPFAAHADPRSGDYSDGIHPPMHMASAMHQPPLLTKLMADRLEASYANASPYAQGLNWDLSGWYGSQLNRLWLKSEGERAANRTEDANIEALFSHAIAPFWNAQLGLRHDLAVADKPARDWASLGISGIAPYWFELEAALYVGEQQHSALRLKGSYELRITQRLIVEPSMEAWLYGKPDVERGIGAGLSNLETGLRLRYEISRRFAPYLGVSRNWLFADTRAQARATGADSAATQWVAGVRLWY